MEWPWAIYTLSDAEKHNRRLALDKYGLYAQISAFLPAALYLAYRIAQWTSRTAEARGDYAPVAQSPVLKSLRASTTGNWGIAIRRVRWWLQDEVRIGGSAYGQRDQWLAGSLWTLWLVFLSVHGTGRGECLL
jgi:hypothetical protein